ncbi:hypothetical protein [Actinoplanes sp. HUAS TT8]|uniref:hypothetical protein n=1 Tax=Actinoplanes sp. HUAS TT8 TaxID=3447453 RepID=UPI003F51F6C7
MPRARRTARRCRWIRPAPRAWRPLAVAVLLTLVLARTADTAAGPGLCLLILAALGATAYVTRPRRSGRRRPVFRSTRKARRG